MDMLKENRVYKHKNSIMLYKYSKGVLYSKPSIDDKWEPSMLSANNFMKALRSDIFHEVVEYMYLDEAIKLFREKEECTVEVHYRSFDQEYIAVNKHGVIEIPKMPAHGYLVRQRIFFLEEVE